LNAQGAVTSWVLVLNSSNFADTIYTLGFGPYGTQDYAGTASGYVNNNAGTWEAAVTAVPEPSNLGNVDPRLRWPWLHGLSS
jgi:hypothetical protein